MLAQTLLMLTFGALAPLQDGIEFYDTLQFEEALVQLRRAELEALTVEDRIATQLYLGLTQAELGSKDLAKAAFQNALVLDPAAQLPIKTSPKIEALFQDLKTQLNEALAAPLPATRTELGVVEEDPATVQVPPEALGTLPKPGEIPGEPPGESRGPRLRPLLVGGGSVAALGGGIAFGLLSRGSTAAARDEPVQLRAAERVDGARGQALTANLLFGAATALAIGAAVDYFLFSPDEPSAP